MSLLNRICPQSKINQLPLAIVINHNNPNKVIIDRLKPEMFKWKMFLFLKRRKILYIKTNILSKTKMFNLIDNKVWAIR